MKEKSTSLLAIRQRNTRKVAALFLAPVTILMIVYIFYPIVDTFITSTYQWNGISADKKFIGIQNWITLIQDKSFWIAFKNNLIIMVLSIVIQIPLGLALATFLDFGGKKLTVFKVIWFIPLLMSSVAIGFLFTYALATNGGIVSTISGWFGGGNIDLLGNPKQHCLQLSQLSAGSLHHFIWYILWLHLPIFLMMYLKQPGLTALPGASISGGSRFLFWYLL